MLKDEFYELYNGVKIPKIGFGTWQIENDDAYNSTLLALKSGYRHIDTAFAYNNEEGVGRAIKDSNIDRKDIFIVSKLPAEIKNYEKAKEYFKKSLNNLGLDYMDLYLIHAPWPWNNVGEDCSKGNVEVWKALIELYNDKLIRSIGVSNFHEKDIEPLIENTGVKPMVNQIRYFIGNRQDSITNYCLNNNILIEAYSPLGTGELITKEQLRIIADKYNVSIARLCLRYCIQKGTLPIPKSTHENRIIENIDLDFIIEKKDMDYLDSLNHIGSTRPLRS